MEIILSFVIWAGFIYLIMRLGNHAQAMRAGQHRRPAGLASGIAGSPQLRWLPPEKDTDPVCQQVIATDKAKPSVYAGQVYYFCSRDCREIFEAAPDLYVGGAGNSYQQLEHAHV